MVISPYGLVCLVMKLSLIGVSKDNGNLIQAQIWLKLVKESRIGV